MRWLVLTASTPEAHRPPGTAHAQPPGPGFPTQAPSVYTVVVAVTGGEPNRPNRPSLQAGYRRGRERHDLRRVQPPAARHRPGPDVRVGRLLRSRRREPGQVTRPLLAPALARPGPPAAGRLPCDGE